MNKEQAHKEALRVKSYFPFRIVGIYQENSVWCVLTGVTKAKFNNLAKKGLEVYILN